MSISESLMNLEGSYYIGNMHSFFSQYEDEIPDDYYKFSFVRNPFSRIVSFYKMILANKANNSNTFRSYLYQHSSSFPAFLRATDKIKEEFNISKIDFIKTDCEGGEYSIFNNKNFFWIKENVKKIVGEWHLETPERKQQFRVFRDTYLRLFPNVEIFSVDGVNIKWDLWNEHLIDYYYQVIIYIDNRD